MELDLSILDYTTVSRRIKKNGHTNVSSTIGSKAIHLVVDSTVVKVYGGGKWKTRQHDVAKRRTWHKLYLGVN